VRRKGGYPDSTAGGLWLYYRVWLGRKLFPGIGVLPGPAEDLSADHLTILTFSATDCECESVDCTDTLGLRVCDC
jgi:hypothetical protein